MGRYKKSLWQTHIHRFTFKLFFQFKIEIASFQIVGEMSFTNTSLALSTATITIC